MLSPGRRLARWPRPASQLCCKFFQCQGITFTGRIRKAVCSDAWDSIHPIFKKAFEDSEPSVRASALKFAELFASAMSENDKATVNKNLEVVMHNDLVRTFFFFKLIPCIIRQIGGLVCLKVTFKIHASILRLRFE